MIAGVIAPGLMLLGILGAMALSRPALVPADLEFAAPVVQMLRDEGVRVRWVARWSHAPFEVGQCAVTMLTDDGPVQLVVLANEQEVRRIEIVESEGDQAGRYLYRVSGWPNGPNTVSWESGYRWFIDIHRNSLVFTTDPALDQTVKKALRRAISEPACNQTVGRLPA